MLQWLQGSEMTAASIVVPEFYQNNRLFDLNDPITNRDNYAYSAYLLRKTFLKNRIDLNTSDISPIADSEIVFFSDMPENIPQKKTGQKFYLIAMESIAVLPRNFNTDLYNCFDKIFTWYDKLIDNKKIIKINYAFLLKPLKNLEYHEKNKLASIVANNKLSSHPSELYSERKKVIDYFVKNHPEDMDLFGIGWEEDSRSYYYVKRIFNILHIPLKLFNILDKLFLNTLFRKRINLYKGMLAVKLPKLREYRFNICYENVADVPGYITEKIFDCFLAGTVPVYLGAPNITNHIPQNTFIDKRLFASYDELYNFIKNMPADEYQLYIENIKKFLKSEQAYKFSAEYYADTIISEVLKDIKGDHL